jgi:hypothetical protein
MASSASPLSALPGRKSRGKRAQTWAKDAQIWAGELRARHPVKTAEHVAALTGEPVATIRKWLEGRARPGWRAWLKLIGVYGPDILAAAFETPPEWLDEAARAQKRAWLAAEYAALQERPWRCYGDSGCSGTRGRNGSGPGSPSSPSPRRAITR